MKIISIDVMSTGVIAYYVLIASRDGLFTPILSDVQNENYADPVPQAVILTAKGITMERVKPRRSPGLIFLDIFLITFTPKTIV